MKTMLIANHLVFLDLNYSIIQEANRIKNEDISICAFNLSNHVIPVEVPIFNPSAIDSFYDGLMIGFDLESVKHMINSYTNSKKVLYLWNMSWFGDNFSYSELYDIINNPKIDIILRSQEQYNVLKQICKKEMHVIENFNLESIWNLLKDTDKK